MLFSLMRTPPDGYQLDERDKEKIRQHEEENRQRQMRELTAKRDAVIEETLRRGQIPNVPKIERAVYKDWSAKETAKEDRFQATAIGVTVGVLSIPFAGPGAVAVGLLARRLVRGFLESTS